MSKSQAFWTTFAGALIFFAVRPLVSRYSPIPV